MTIRDAIVVDDIFDHEGNLIVEEGTRFEHDDFYAECCIDGDFICLSPDEFEFIGDDGENEDEQRDS